MAKSSMVSSLPDVVGTATAQPWGAGDKHPLDPGWMWQLAPSVRALIFEDDASRSMLKKIRQGRRTHTALRTAMFGSFTPIFWALGIVAASATAIIALPLGLTIAPIVTWGAWGSLAGLTAAYHAIQVAERRLRVRQMHLWNEFAERLSRKVMERARSRHNLSMSSLERTSDVDLQECDRFAKRLLGIATLGREMDENHSRRMGALWGVLPFAPVVVPLAYLFGRWRRSSDRQNFFEAQKLGTITAESDSDFAASTNELISTEAISGARWSGLEAEVDALHIDAFDRFVKATMDETQLRQKHELQSTGLLSNLASLVMFVASAAGTAPATTLIVNNAIGMWASQLALLPGHEMAVTALAKSSESFDRVLQAAADVVPSEPKQNTAEIGGPFRVWLNSLVLQRGEHSSVEMSGRVLSGELTAVSGPNGSFKSSLMLALRGDLTPHKGHVRADKIVGGLSVEVFPEVLYMPANTPALLKARLAKWGENRERVETALRRLGRTEDQIRDLLTNTDGALNRMSKGEQARTIYELTVALSDAPVVVLDEPLAHIDRVNARKFLRNLREFAVNDERAIVVVDNTGHSIAECDRLILLDKAGRVRTDDNPLDVLLPCYLPPWAWPLIEHRNPYMREVRDSLTGEDNRVLAEKWHERVGNRLSHRMPPELNDGEDPVVTLFRMAGSKVVRPPTGVAHSSESGGSLTLTFPSLMTYFDNPFQPSAEFLKGAKKVNLIYSPSDRELMSGDRAVRHLMAQSESLVSDAYATAGAYPGIVAKSRSLG